MKGYKKISLAIKFCSKKVKEVAKSCRKSQKVTKSLKRPQKVTKGCKKSQKSTKSCKRLQKVTKSCKKLSLCQGKVTKSLHFILNSNGCYILAKNKKLQKVAKAF